MIAGNPTCILIAAVGDETVVQALGVERREALIEDHQVGHQRSVQAIHVILKAACLPCAPDDEPGSALGAALDERGVLLSYYAEVRMPYSDFTLVHAEHAFELRRREVSDLFADVRSMAPTP